MESWRGGVTSKRLGIIEEGLVPDRDSGRDKIRRKVLTWGQVEHILLSWKALNLPELYATI